MKRLALVTMVAGALAFAPKPAEAALLSGSFSIVPVSAPAPGPVLAVDSTGTITSLGLATGLDFTTTGTLTPGTAGLFTVDTASGSFAVINGLTGTIADFSFAGAGSPSYPLPPITGFQLIAGPSFSVDLLTISIFSQASHSLELRGTVLFHLAGFDPTPGTFVFTAEGGFDNMTFAATETAVPEPGSMLMLGTGLLGLAAIIRRRRKA